MIILGCWILSLIVSFRHFFRVTYVKDAKKCVSSVRMFKARVTLFSILVVISSALMIGLYSRVVYTLWFKHQGENMLTPQQQVRVSSAILNSICVVLTKIMIEIKSLSVSILDKALIRISFFNLPLIALSF